MGFLSSQEVEKMGFSKVGFNVLISDRAVFHAPERISLGNHVRIDDYVVASGSIYFGNYVHIGVHCSILASTEKIEFEDFSGLAPGCRVFAVSDDYSGFSLTNPTVPLSLRSPRSGHVLFGKHSIVGANSVVLPGVTINEGASVGALSLVTKDIDAWTIVAGVPTRRLKDRNREILKLESHLLKKVSP